MAWHGQFASYEPREIGDATRNAEAAPIVAAKGAYENYQDPEQLEGGNLLPPSAGIMSICMMVASHGSTCSI